MVTASEIYLHHVGHSPVLFTLGCYTLSTHLLMLLLLPQPSLVCSEKDHDSPCTSAVSCAA